MSPKKTFGLMTLAAISAILLATCAPTGGPAPNEETVVFQGTTVNPGAPRVRAWVLLTTDDVTKSAEAIVPYFIQGGEEWVVVRADVIEGGENIMVAVDAASESSLQEVIGILTDVVGSEPQAVWRVAVHYPSVPHAAHSFVTESELDPELGGLYAEEFSPPGRHMPKSPGANPWG